MRVSVVAPAVFLACALAAEAAEAWTRLASPNFELYTNASEKRGKETILYFEQVRDVFLRITGSKGTSLPVRIIAFKSPKDFEPYNFRESSAAYYLGGWERDYIVMGNIGPDHFPVAIHEYTHLITRHSGLDLPVWLSEGLAEVYSTLKPVGNKVTIGSLIPSRIALLQQSKWLDTRALMTADQNSPFYNEKDKRGIFYSQSWALTHMLYLSDEYRSGFTKLLMALGKGTDPADAFREIYGKTLGEVHDDSMAYLRGNRFYAAIFDTKLQKSAEAPAIEPASEFEAGLVLLELIASSPSRKSQAKAAYNQLESTAPSAAGAHESLAAMAMQLDSKDAAAKHLTRALELGTKNPKLFFNYAAYLRRTGEEPSVFLPQLERAATLDTAYDDANYLIGLYAYQERDFKKASQYLRRVRKVTPEQAIPFFSMLAYSNHEAGLTQEALAAAERARAFAKTSEDVARAESLIRYLSSDSSAAPAPVETPSESAAVPRTMRQARRQRTQPELETPPETLTVEGTVEQIDCAVNGAVFHVLSKGRKLRYAIDDPNLVVLKNSESGKLEFRCGAQQKPFAVMLEFLPKVDAAAGTLGAIRAIEFK